VADWSVLRKQSVRQRTDTGWCKQARNAAKHFRRGCLGWASRSGRDMTMLAK
jgi:hypothetical protein